MQRLTTINKKIDKAKMHLMLGDNTTFFSALLANLRLDITDNIPTACTNGVYLKMNPDFVMKQTQPQLVGLKLHEVMHVAFDHVNMIAYSNLDQVILNIAMDHYINLYITSLGYEIPDGGYCDKKYMNMSSMEIYHDLMKNPPPDVSSYIPDIVVGDDQLSPTDLKETITTNIIKAVMQADMAKDAGSVPGSVRVALEEVMNPKLPWQTILMNHLDQYARDDYSWKRPNRRFQPEFYMPSLHSEGLKQVTAGGDVSISMNKEDIDAYFAELRYIWDVFQPEQMRVMTFDTKVHLNDMFTEGEQLKELELMGRGGTNCQPLIDSIRKEDPVFALIFTDGYFTMPDMKDLTTDIFWIIVGNPSFNPPYGTVIPFK